MKHKRNFYIGALLILLGLSIGTYIGAGLVLAVLKTLDSLVQILAH